MLSRCLCLHEDRLRVDYVLIAHDVELLYNTLYIFYYILSLFLAHYCILRVILLLSDYEANFGVNIFFYQSVQVIFYCMVKSHLAANISILLVH